MRRWALLVAALAAGCDRQDAAAPPPAEPTAPSPPARRAMPWGDGKPLADGEVFSLAPERSRREPIEAARAAGLLVVDLSDEWAPFIFSESDPGGEVKPNAYRQTFIALANNRTTPNQLFLESPEGRQAVLMAAGMSSYQARKGGAETPEGKKALEAARRTLRSQEENNFLEVYGIPPTLSVLQARIEGDARKDCFAALDTASLAAFDGTVGYQNRDQARKEFDTAAADAAWAQTLEVPDAGDAKIAARLERHRRGAARVAAIRAAQARLACEGLLRGRYTEGMFDLATHEALAEFERKNDIFGWGFIGEETTKALVRPPLELHFETLKRILQERVVDAAGILEDGSVSRGKRPATYKDERGQAQPVPDLVGEHVAAVLAAMAIETPDDMVAALRALRPANLRVAIPPPPLPPYHAPGMDLSVEIDRGDVWYDFPFDDKGKAAPQRRDRFPHLTLFVSWNKQRIPLARWRTTIGSWRSELGADGRLYYKYKNSDVGPRIWKNIVAAPVWIPPDSTPAKDLLTQKVLDRNVGPVTVVNTDVMGPGFQSAYGLVMAIHLQQFRNGGVFDNQIRTHGSVDYTSIARRFSHGCHRLVNNRAVRLFGFVLRHRRFERKGDLALTAYRRQIVHEDKEYEFSLKTRGYYYELTPPLAVNVLEGRVMGAVKQPITAYVRKPGVDYGPGPSAEGLDFEGAPTPGP